MTISRFTKTDSEHCTVVLSNDQDPFKIQVDRTPDGRLRVNAEDYRHTFVVVLNKAEETELLSKLQFA